jgi:CheY-like chemotaxis protein
MGFEVDETGSPNVATSPESGEYVLALVDVSLLPDHKDQLGVEVALRLRKTNPDIRIIIISAYLQTEFAKSEVLSKGIADEVITKEQFGEVGKNEDTNLLVDVIRKWIPSIQIPQSLGNRAESAWKRAARNRRQKERAERQGLPPILVVEDQIGWADLLSQIIERAGGFADTVKTYQHAMSQMQGRSYPAAIVDLRLSTVDNNDREGMIFVQDTIKKYPDTKFIIVSAFLDKNIKSELFSLGVLSIEDKLQFPEDQYHFFETLQSILNKFVPIESQEWNKIITDFLKACKHNKQLNDTVLAHHPKFTHYDYPGVAAENWIQLLIQEKKVDGLLTPEKQSWMNVLANYYFSKDNVSPTWPTLANKLHHSVRKLKYLHSQAIQELARIAFQELNNG